MKKFNLLTISYEINESLEKESNTTADDESISSSNDYKKTGETQNTSKFKYKKESDKCMLNSHIEKYGAVMVNSENFKKMQIAKIENVNFNTDKEIFEKGRREVRADFKRNMHSLPELKFWHQRYYYYSKYDSGIMMDYESNYFISTRLVLGYTGRTCRLHCSASEGVGRGRWFLWQRWQCHPIFQTM
jgi:hypothetical protein